MLSFTCRNEMVLWVIDNYLYGYMYKMIELVNLNDNMLAREIKKVTNGQLRMLKENNKYFLEYFGR